MGCGLIDVSRRQTQLDSPYCVFSDASEDAFGPCAYVRWQLSTGGFNAQFIAAKSRVAPLKKLTIPRLELQGAVLASRLGKTILKESQLKFEKSVFFLDSKIVLASICSETRRFKPLVSVRVGQFQENSDPAQWRHVPGEQNVADEVSRGIPVESLTAGGSMDQTFCVSLTASGRKTPQ